MKYFIDTISDCCGLTKNRSAQSETLTHSYNYGYLKYLKIKCIIHLFLLIQTRTFVNGRNCLQIIIK